MRVSAKKMMAVVTTAMAVVSFSRVAVLFLESLSVVREERTADYDLLELCRAGSAKQSPKMRTACLQANAERASPVVLKAIVRAVSTTFREFAESVNSPFGFATVALFVVSSLVLPIGPILKVFLSSWREKSAKLDYDSDDLESVDNHVIMIPSNLKRRASRSLKMNE